MRSRKKLTKTQRLIKKYICIIIAIVVSVVVFYEFTVRDTLQSVITAKIKTLSHSAVNGAVEDYISDNAALCDELITISSGNSGVSSITENSYNVNTFKTGINNLSQKYIDNRMKKDGIDINLGNFIGLVILSEMGPNVHINIESTPTVTSEIVSSFESTAMNQSIHHIELVVNVDIYVGNPFRIESIKINTKYEIAQTVIVGNIPSTYGTISRY